MSKTIHWTDNTDEIIAVASDALLASGQVVVTPTKVGYIIATSDSAGLERKFELKNRAKRKPAVVLCASIEQLQELAQTDAAIDELYKRCYRQDSLLGCILPWRPTAIKDYVSPDAAAMIHDTRQTSCFVIRYGELSEKIARNLWEKDRRLVFASSANPSGQGNRGQLTGVGTRIFEGADLLIEADAYVKNQQPDKDTDTRYEQGVMVSMVDESGALTKLPTVIRKGLGLDYIMHELSELYDNFDYRHGQYY